MALAAVVLGDHDALPGRQPRTRKIGSVHRGHPVGSTSHRLVARVARGLGHDLLREGLRALAARRPFALMPGRPPPAAVDEAAYEVLLRRRRRVPPSLFAAAPARWGRRLGRRARVRDAALPARLAPPSRRRSLHARRSVLSAPGPTGSHSDEIIVDRIAAIVSNRVVPRDPPAPRTRAIVCS